MWIIPAVFMVFGVGAGLILFYIRWGFQNKKQLITVFLRMLCIVAVFAAVADAAIYVRVERTYDTPLEAAVADHPGFDGSDWDGTNPEPAYQIQGKEMTIFAVYDGSFTIFPSARYEDDGWKSGGLDSLEFTGQCGGAVYEIESSRQCSECMVIVNTVLDSTWLDGNKPKEQLEVSDSMGSAFEAVQVRASNGKAYHQYYTILPQWEEGYTITIDGETDEPTPIWWR
ncbi:hypothetical protein [Butyricicoccus sp.]|uniref:hypothetical protein n=1 Tax=Butyricicoccus sp. TaxID=2049021 RepID=UPI003F18BE02